MLSISNTFGFLIHCQFLIANFGYYIRVFTAHEYNNSCRKYIYLRQEYPICVLQDK